MCVVKNFSVSFKYVCSSARCQQTDSKYYLSRFSETNTFAHSLALNSVFRHENSAVTCTNLYVYKITIAKLFKCLNKGLERASSKRENDKYNGENTGEAYCDKVGKETKYNIYVNVCLRTRINYFIPLYRQFHMCVSLGFDFNILFHIIIIVVIIVG